jgi:cytochrome oxidase assembly protein ShyY1
VPSYAFARRPKWIAGHVLTVVLLVTFVLAGFWQWNRHNERRDRNAAVTARADLPPLTPAELGSGDPSDLEYRTVEADGTWDRAGEVLIRARSHQGQSGCHVVSPLRIADGTALLVNRGFVPLTVCESPTPVADAPVSDGEVTVEGLARRSQRKGTFGAAADPGSGVLEAMNRIDVPRIAQQYDRPLAPLYVELHSQSPPPPADLPFPVDPPELGAGPHLGYTVQWFLFAVVAVVGYPLVLRRQARREQAAPDASPVEVRH